MLMTTDAAARLADANALCRDGRALWGRDQPTSAIERAWSAFDLAPSNGEVKRLLAALLWNFPHELSPLRRQDFLQLLSDREVDPADLCPAGWDLVLQLPPFADGAGEAMPSAHFAELAQQDALVLALLREAPVCSPVAERMLTGLRRWLLVSGEWQAWPVLMAAFAAQAQLNGGAWPFDDSERALLEHSDDAPLAAYVPRRAKRVYTGSPAHPVTHAVRAQYEQWPYPAWTRITHPRPRRLPDLIRRMSPQTADNLPVDARILVAGCGTGRQAAALAHAYPDAFLTAIDISQASLDYAERQCRSLGPDRIEFRKLDLYEAARLERKFDAIFCAGVLHHLPDPERGLEALAAVLQPAGVMNIAVYTKIARLFIEGARKLVADLSGKPVSDDLLREIRRRFLARPDQPLMNSITWGPEFGTLTGVYDLLLHQHEDPFDIPRIDRALQRAGLAPLSLALPSPLHETQYDAMFPHDPGRRDFRTWAAFEARYPRAFAGMCQFWCRREDGGVPT